LCSELICPLAGISFSSSLTLVLNRVGDKLQPCLKPLIPLKPFVIRFQIFIFELDPLYNDFIYSINLVLIVDLSRVSHNLYNGTLSYAFVKSINIYHYQ